MSTLSNMLPFVAAGLIALIGYLVLDGLSFSFSRSATSRLENFSGKQETLADRLGGALMRRLGLDLKAWELDLRWAQIGGDYLGESVAMAVGQSAIYAAIGLILIFGMGLTPISIGATFFLATLPYQRLHKSADKVRATVRASLPEAAAFVAGEMAAGVSADQALTRAGRLPGPLGVILREAAEASGTGNRLMLSKSGVKGVFREQVETLEMPHLASFAAQADLVAQRGAEGPAQMSGIARMLSRAYRTEVRRAAAELDNTLLMPTTLYFFVPMLAAMLVPLGVGIFTMFF
jgi:Flp pilus assembly protein TadB